MWKNLGDLKSLSPSSKRRLGENLNGAMVRTVLAHPSLLKPERARPRGHLPVQEVMSSLLWLHPDPLQVSHTGPQHCRSFSSRVLSHRSQRVAPCLSRAAGLSCQLFQNHCYACTHTCTHTHTHIPQSLGPWNQAQTPFPPASLPLPIEPSSFLITMDPSARFTQLLMCAVLSLPRLLAPRVK